MNKLFGTDGIRGLAGTELSAEIAFRLGNALAQEPVPGRKEVHLLLAKDTRISCDMLESAVASGAAAGGMTVHRCGIMPTPALAYATRAEQALGVMISASHNSYEYNGLKVISQGYKLPDRDEERIEEIMLSGNLMIQKEDQIGRVLDHPKARGDYLQYLYRWFEDLHLGGLRVVFDAANGASHSVASEVFRTLGANVIPIHDQPNGLNINLQCGSQHPESLIQLVLENKAQIGIAHDGDADRCILVDHTGNIIDGDAIIAICASHYKKRNTLSKDTIVTTVMSNMGLEVFLKEQGIRMVRTRVGDRYVLEKMKETGAIIGGEQSGHVIFLDKSTTGDGLLTALTILEHMVESGKSLRDLAAPIPHYPQVLYNLPIKDKDLLLESEDLKAVEEKVKKTLGDLGRVLIRPSGTEPLVRIMLEGTDAEMIEELAQLLIQEVKRIDA